MRRVRKRRRIVGEKAYSMNDPFRMQVLQTIHNLRSEEPTDIIAEISMFHDTTIDRSTRHVFEEPNVTDYQ
jgi:hypothetical protein